MRQHALEKIEWKPAESTNIRATYWDDMTQTLCVMFNNGGLYSYIGPSFAQYLDFTNSVSMGRYLHNVLKAFPTTRWQSEHDLLDHLNIG